MAAENLLVKQVFVLLSVVSMDSPAITDNGSCLEECVPVNNGLMGIPDNHIIFRFLPLEFSAACTFYLYTVVDSRPGHCFVL